MSKVDEVAEAIRQAHKAHVGERMTEVYEHMARAAIEAADKWQVEQIRALMESMAPWDEPTVLCGRPENFKSQRWKTMNEMVERVARALCVWLHGHHQWDDMDQIDRNSALEAARAAIEALREPTQYMLAATIPFPEHLCRSDDSEYCKRMKAAALADRMGVRSDWEKMIDAALSEEG